MKNKLMDLLKDTENKNNLNTRIELIPAYSKIDYEMLDLLFQFKEPTFKLLDKVIEWGHGYKTFIEWFEKDILEVLEQYEIKNIIEGLTKEVWLGGSKW